MRTGKKKPRGRPFPPGNHANPSGRPKNPDGWSEARDTLKADLVWLLAADKTERERRLKNNPTGSLVTAAAFMRKHPEGVVERLMGKVPQAVIGDPDSPPVVLTFVPFPGVEPIKLPG